MVANQSKGSFWVPGSTNQKGGQGLGLDLDLGLGLGLRGLGLGLAHTKA